MFNDDLSFWLRTIAYAAFAALGGLMGYILRTIDREQRVSWLRAIMEALAAGFVGLLVLFACQAMHLTDEWIGVIVGVSGWLGANASIRLLETLVYRKLGLHELPRHPRPRTKERHEDEDHDDDSYAERLKNRSRD